MKKSCLKKIIADVLLSTTLLGSTAFASGVNNSWVQTDSKWSYIQSDGTLAKGWKQIYNIWYYFEEDGTMKVGWKLVDNKWYYLQSDGAMKIGWISDAGHWYYLNNSGAMATGWISYKGKYYYLNSNGDMAENTTTPDGYFVDASGVWDGQGQKIYTGNQIKQKLYGLGFIDKGDSLCLNPYNTPNDTSTDYMGFRVLSGDTDMSLTILSSTSEVDQKIKTILNWILPTQGNYLYSVLDSQNLRSQTLYLEGRTVTINKQTSYLIVVFGPIIK